MLYSGQSFGEFAFGEHDFAPPGESAFAAFLREVTAPRCWLLEMDAFSLATTSDASSAFGDAGYGELAFSDDAPGTSGGVRTLRFSTHGYTSHHSDSPAAVWYEGRLTEEINVDRRIVGRDGLGGLARVFADASLIALDGGVDDLLRDYSLDGRPARILLGRPTDSLAEYGVVFRGVVAAVSISLERATVQLSDGLALLDRPIQENLYAGTGGLEGGADLAGKPKPLAFGRVLNIAPPLVDAVNLIYQVHDGPIQDVTAVYDRGVSLTRVDGTPAPGEYSVDVSAGTFRLGAAPAGTVTADVLGDASLSGYVESTAQIVLRILATRAQLTSSAIEPLSFTVLDTDVPAPVGIWVGLEPRTIADVVDELLAGAGAFGGFDRLGRFGVGRIRAASGVEAADYTSEDIVVIEREPLPPAIEPVVWRAIVGYRRNYTVQTDLAASVPAAHKTFAAVAYRSALAEDDAVRTRYVSAKTLGPIESAFADAADAQAEAARLLGLWSKRRSLLRIRTQAPALLRDLGDVVLVCHPRHGLQNGALGIVVSHAFRGGAVEMGVLV